MTTSTPTHPTDAGNQMSNGIVNQQQLSPDINPSSIPGEQHILCVMFP